MSESTGVFKVLVFLGLVMVMVGLMYPGSGSSWTGLQSTLTTGLNLPTFNNPFAPKYSYVTLIPNANGTAVSGWPVIVDVSDIDHVYGCSSGQYWLCVQTLDYDASYVSLNSAHDTIAVNVTDYSIAATSIVSMSVRVTCRALNESVGWFSLAYDGSFVFAGMDSCPLSSQYANVTVDIPNPWTLNDQWNDNNAVAALNQSSATAEVRVTYMEVVIGIAEVTTCAGGLDGIPCAIGNFFGTIIKAVQFLINGAVFAIASVIAVLIFVFTIIAGFLGGLIGTMLFFLALPDAPPIIQYILDILFIGLIGWVVYVIFKSVRGTSTI